MRIDTSQTFCFSGKLHAFGHCYRIVVAFSSLTNSSKP